jgi:hypothetical protein
VQQAAQHAADAGDASVEDEHRGRSEPDQETAGERGEGGEVLVGEDEK